MTATATSISEAYAYVLEKLSGDARVGAVYTRSQRDDHRIWILRSRSTIPGNSNSTASPLP